MNAEARAKAAQLRSWLLGYVKQPDADPVLDGTLRTWASLQTVIARQRRGLHKLHSAEDCPRRQLPGLGALVGFDRATRVARLLEERDWRQAIPTAKRVWRDVGLLDGIKDAVVAATARPCAVGDWHAWKDVTDQTTPPHPGLPTPPAFEALATLWVRAADPADDVDRRALAEAYLHDVREPKRAFVISWMRLVETWAQGSWQWEDVGTTPHTASAISMRLNLPPRAAVLYRADLERPRVRAWVLVPEGAAAHLHVRAGELVVRVEAKSQHRAFVSVRDGEGQTLAGPVERPWNTTSAREVVAAVEPTRDVELLRVDIDGDLVLAAEVAAAAEGTGVRLGTPSDATTATTWHYVEASDGAPLVTNIDPTKP